jgi:CheY-like chemotaxis protein
MLRSEPDTRDIPVMFLTGKDDKESVVKVLSLKPEGYLLKSIEKDKLIKELGKFFS